MKPSSRASVFHLSAAIVLAGTLLPAFAAAPPQIETLSPAVSEALKGMASEEFATREKAQKDIQSALAQQIKALLSTGNPETQSRLVSLMEFNDGLSRWAIEVLKLPNDARQAQLTWGTQPQTLDMIAKLYSTHSAQRIEGIKLLAKDDGAQAGVVFGRLLEDDMRAVYIAAMEAVWDRKPSEPLVNALFNRAVDSGLGVQGQPNNTAVMVAFRGRNLGPTYENMNRPTLDSNIAAEVLMNYKTPLLVEKLKSALNRIDEQLSDDNPHAAARAWSFLPSTEPVRNLYKLAENSQSRELIPVLLKLANSRVLTRSSGSMNAEKYFWSNRTAPLATVIQIVGQDAKDYKMKRLSTMNSTWVSPTEAEEDATLKKFNEWWVKNSEKFGIETAAARAQITTQPAATRPTDDLDTPVLPPGVIILPAPAGKNVLKLQIQLRGNGINGGIVETKEIPEDDAQKEPAKNEPKEPHKKKEPEKK